MKKIVGLAVVCVFCVTGSLFAQGQGKAGSIGLALGVTRPTDSAMRNATGSTWTLGQLDYTWQGSKSTMRASVGYASKSGTKIIPIKLTMLCPLESAGMAHVGLLPQTYWGLGIGAYHVKPDKGDSNTKAGLSVLLGTTLASNWRAEIGYDWVSKVNGTNPGYFSAMLGYQFK